VLLVLDESATRRANVVGGAGDERNPMLGRQVLAELRQELPGGLEIGPEGTVEKQQMRD
jgi:hypothetical protein